MYFFIFVSAVVQNSCLLPVDKYVYCVRFTLWQLLRYLHCLYFSNSDQTPIQAWHGPVLLTTSDLGTKSTTLTSYKNTWSLYHVFSRNIHLHRYRPWLIIADFRVLPPNTDGKIGHLKIWERRTHVLFRDDWKTSIWLKTSSTHINLFF